MIATVLSVADQAWADNAHRDYISFESAELPPAWRATGDGELKRSDRHYKHGRHCLEWAWKGGAPLLAENPEGLERAATSIGGGSDGADRYEPRFVEAVKQGGVMAWVYSEAPIDGALTFEFGSTREIEADNPRYRFEFRLNYEGWRAMWVHFEEDAKNPAYTGDDPASTMKVTPPAGVPEGRVYFDLVNFTEYASWKRVADCQLPFINREAVNNDPDEEAHNWASPLIWWNRVSSERGDDYAVTEPIKQAFDKIERRYETWVLGDDTLNLDQEPYRTRYKSLRGLIDRAVKKYEGLEIRRRGETILGQPLFALRSPYQPSFGRTVHQPIILYLALDYRLNGNQSSLERFIDLVDYLHDQGWAAGSGLGTLNHEALRMSGYYHAVFLMREPLAQRDRLSREVATMRWFSNFNKVYDPVLDIDVSADKLRSVAMFRLLTVLSMADSPAKAADMAHLREWMGKALAVAPGFMDTIKPDYMGYHHRGVYANAYAPVAYHMASLITYLVHGTPFEIPAQARENLRRALLTQRTISNLYDVPVGVAGRFPHNLGITHQILPAYAYMALSGDPLDKEMARAFMRLWRPETDYLQKDLFPEAANGITYLDTLGSLQIMMRLADRQIAPETAPQGHWTKPYAALAIHRRDNWMAAVKGWSQYVWDFESSRTENLFGRYVSYGAMQIYNAGDPINAQASGYRLDRGWDWNRWPGATTIHLPLDQLRTDRRVTEAYPEGKHRNFTDQTTVGGTSLDGRYGMFGMSLHDTVYERSFRALKSVFFFGDRMICLGSAIENDQGEYPTETTLFQTYLPRSESEMWVNGESVTDIPFTWSGQSRSAWLVDPVGNGYVVPDASDLRVARQAQQSRDHRDQQQTRGDYAVAWFDHGAGPESGTYAYTILADAGPERTAAYAEDPQHVVLRQDDRVHIVQDPSLGLTAYAIYDNRAEIGHGPVASSTVPCFVMARETEPGMTLSFCDPDLRRPKMRNMSLMPIWILRARSVGHQARLRLHGRWAIAADLPHTRLVNRGVDPQGQPFTELSFDTRRGETVRVELQPAD